MKVVADTNILVSYVLVPAGNPARILENRKAGRFDLLMSEAILAECSKVLGYKRLRTRHQLSDEGIGQVIEDIRELSTLVDTKDVKLDVVDKDPDDNIVVECAVAGGADYIVSGDMHLLSLQEYRGIQILPPAAFLLMLGRNEPMLNC